MTITAETIRELREAIALDAEREPTTGFKYHSITIGMVMNRITDLLDALEAERAENQRRKQHLEAMQKSMLLYLLPDSRVAPSEFIDSMLTHLDGPEQRALPHPTEGKRDE